MVNNSTYHRSNLEKVLMMDDDLNFQTALRDVRIQIFIILADNPHRSYTLDELLKQIRIKSNIDKELLENKSRVNTLLNLMFSYELISHDFMTKTYRYKDSITSDMLKENIDKIKISTLI
jgi:hypothetical protein